ncbi:hypothetical protein OOT33_03675 [Sphingobium sp. DEHP117]|uniref:hypothetical protein n=1 Tax=Sphingobium sp. DEHP117 TaxID=2993436 RepID=UPI0027D687E7|nr:hypothetical protein [Sphingobium sp. DEHP117]MDQ4419538.1 hypothetical protein [Sphingobium sp. DEHP117]
MLIDLRKRAILCNVVVTLVSCGTPTTNTDAASNLAKEVPSAPLHIPDPRWKGKCAGSFEYINFHYPGEMAKSELSDIAFWPEWDLHRERLRTKDKETFGRTVYKIVVLSQELNRIWDKNGDASEIFYKIRALRKDIIKYYDYKNNGMEYPSTILFLYENLFIDNAIYEFLRTGQRKYIDIAYDENVIGKNIIPEIDYDIKNNQIFFDRNWVLQFNNNIAFFALKSALDNNLVVANYLNEMLEKNRTEISRQVEVQNADEWKSGRCDKKQKELYKYENMMLLYEAYRYHPDDNKKNMIEEYINVFPQESNLSKYIIKIKYEISKKEG